LECRQAALACALADLGYAMWWLDGYDRWLAGPLLAAWLRERPSHLRDAPLLILAEDPTRSGAHWIAAKGWEIGDSLITDCEWRWGTVFPDWRLRSAYVVEFVGG
jgi:hypothetical protein